MKLISQTTAAKNITAIKVAGKKQDTMIHETEMFAIHQANAHGQVTPLNQLLSALNKSARKQALLVHIRDHSKIVVLKTGLVEYRKDKKLYRGTKEITIAEALEFANEKPFYDYTHESKPATKTDALKRFNALVSSLKEFKGTVEHMEVIAKVEAAIADATAPVKAKV